MKNDNKSLGRFGEDLAIHFLKKAGFFVLTCNFRTPVGEIDIVCKKNNLLVFVEVKTRIGDYKGKPYESVTPWKLRHIKKTVDWYVLVNKKTTSPCRIDVISIELHPDRTVKKIAHFKNVL